MYREDKIVKVLEKLFMVMVAILVCSIYIGIGIILFKDHGLIGVALAALMGIAHVDFAIGMEKYCPL